MMKEENIKTILKDQNMEVYNFYMFKILSVWVSFDTRKRMFMVRRLSRHIEIKFINMELFIF